MREYTKENYIFHSSNKKNLQFVEGATTAGMKVIAPNRDDGNVLLLSDDEVVDDVHHILDSSTDV